MCIVCIFVWLLLLYSVCVCFSRENDSADYLKVEQTPLFKGKGREGEERGWGAVLDTSLKNMSWIFAVTYVGISEHTFLVMWI